MTTTRSRLPRLLSLFQARRDWSGSELAGRLEVSGRTIRRDVERLRDLGYPVESVTGPAGGYRLRAETAMPPLLLDDDEAIAIAVGLRTAARASVTGIEETSVRALVKLERVRRRTFAGASGRWARATIAPTVGGPTVDPRQDLTTIAAACRDHERLRLLLPQPRVGIDSRREVEPHSLVNPGAAGTAWDRGCEDWRTFRVDRLARLAAIGPVHAARVTCPGRGCLRRAEHHEAQHRYEARVTIHAPADEVAARVPAYWGTVEEKDARSRELRIGRRRPRWLAVRLAMIPVELEVHEPPEPHEYLRALGRLGRAAGRSR